MENFPTALEHVYQFLRKPEARELKATRQALAQLARRAPQAPVPAAAPARPAPRQSEKLTECDVLFLYGTDESASANEETALLGKIISAMRLPPSRVRTGQSSRDLERFKAKIIVAMGHTIFTQLIDSTEPFDTVRGRWFQLHETPVLVTFHPSYLVHHPENEAKRKLWEDMLEILHKLQRPVSPQQQRFFLPRP